MEHLLDEIKRYIGFDSKDEARLSTLAAIVQPHVHRIIDDFYDRILCHPGASQAITEGAPQVERLKGTLRLWLQDLFVGPWSYEYYEKRARIGRRHVDIRLPQQYMFTAVNVIRSHLLDIILSSQEAQEIEQVHSVNKLLDIELTIMLHTYHEAYNAKMKQHERLVVYGQLAASIAHELRNPLSVIESSAFLLRRRLPPDLNTGHHIEKIEGQVQHANRVITDLLDMVRDKPLRAEMVDLQALATSYREGLSEAKQSHLTLDLQESLPTLWADRNQVLQILNNLVTNAFEAMHDQVLVKIYASENTMHILVNDNGKGIDVAAKTRLFEPLFTTKSRGIGLGLALSRKLAERNGGSLVLSQGPLPGAAFLLMLLLTSEGNSVSPLAG
jgi:two-component system, NtrC family, sensor histidine kinase HydH